MRDLLIEKFKYVEGKLNLYTSVQGSGLKKKIQRFLIVGHPYLEYILFRILNIHLDRKTTLFFGDQIMLPVHDVDSHYLLMFGSLGEAEANLTKYLILNLKDNDIFYDVGANYGFFTMLARKLITKGEIHFFEPQFDLKYYLEKNIVHTDKLFKNYIALSSYTGIAKLYSKHESGASGVSTLKPEVFTDNKKYNVQEVPVTTLDEYIKAHNPPTIIKLDIEGGEADFLDGAMSSIKKFKPDIVMEVWSGDKGKSHSMLAFNTLIKIGYEPYLINGDGSLSFFTIDRNTAQSYVNLLFKVKI